MKSTDTFKNTIKNYLANLSQSDELIAVTLKKENKNIDDCITYILTEVQKSGCNGFADDEIFGMAIHYYDEDTIKVGKPVSGKVVVNHSLPPDPKKEAKPMTKPKPKAVKKPKELIYQSTLF